MKRRLAGHYYAVLGVAPSASQEEIKAAYKRLVLQWHPDRFYAREMESGQAPQQQQAERSGQGIGSASKWLRSGMGITAKSSSEVAAQKFREIVEAYEVLSDERRRQRYNAGGSGAGSNTGRDTSQSWASSTWRGGYPGGGAGMGMGAGAWRARRAGSASWQGGSSFSGSWGSNQGAQDQGRDGGFADSGASWRHPQDPTPRRDLLWVLLMGWLPSSPGALSWRSLSVQELGTGLAAVASLGAVLVWGQMVADAAWATANKGKSFEETLEALKKQRERREQDLENGGDQGPGPD